MTKTDTDFDFLLERIEHSRLPHQKKATFALLLLDACPEELARIADDIKAERGDTIELLALTSISKAGGLGEIKSKRDRILTYDEGIIKDAADYARGRLKGA